jgi:hypothetical protein
MAGPVVSVLLREPLTKAHLKEIDQWLRSVATRVDGAHGRRGEWELWMDGAPVGCRSGEQQCRIVVSLQGPDPYGFGLDPFEAPEIVEEIGTAIGYRTAQGLLVIAMCNQRIDHCLIARLALHFAQRFDAYIDMGGTLTPPLPPAVKKEDGTYVPWFDLVTLDDIRTFLVALPGRVWEISSEDEVDGQISLPSHVVDATFLDAWVRHPHFHMIK